MSAILTPVTELRAANWQSNSAARAPRHNCRPWAVVATLMTIDALCLVAAVAMSVAVKVIIAGPVELNGYWNLWPALLVFLTVYGALGLYSVIALSGPEEIRRVSVSSAVVFVMLAAMTISQRGGRSGVVTWTLILATLLTIALLPIARSAARRLFGRSSWWGYPAVLFGSGSALREALAFLRRDAGLGLIPVAVAGEFLDDGKITEGIPVVPELDLPSLIRRNNATTYAVVALPDLSKQELVDFVQNRCSDFPRVMLLPSFTGLSGLGVESRQVAGEMGLEIFQHIYKPGRRLAKEMIDRLLASVALVGLAPLFALLSLAIGVESGRPIFFGHRRVGRAGRTFRAWKFRSMMRDGDRVLKEYLATHAEARLEWEQFHKLRNDPRVGRVGKFLRETSLDELPQLWNVVRGDMSIVGPRPVVKDEIAKYGLQIDLYYRVKGGITGLWQVSGRNETTYDQRVALDSYYVRNWSVWLDLHIMARTVTAVLFRRGAY